MGIAHAGLAARWQPLATWFYPIVWWAYIVLVDGFARRRGGQGVLAGGWRGVAGPACMSVVFWLIHEAVNLRIANWYYVGVPESRPERWLGITLSFATVIPLLLATHQALLLTRLLGPCKVRRRGVPEWVRRAMQGAGVACLVLPLAFPRHAFWLLWGFVYLTLEPLNHRAGRPSLLADLEVGSVRRLLAALIAGLACGLLWEGWNFWAGGKWIYTVPGLPDWRWFEMPPLGFLGFPLLALAALAFHAAVTGWWRRGGRAGRLALAAGGVVFSVAVLGAMEHVTIDAVRPVLADVTPLAADARRSLPAAGVRSVDALARVADADLNALATRLNQPRASVGAARDWARLATHRGMGAANADRLWAVGIRDVAALAALSPEGLAWRLGSGAPEPRKLAVWINGARPRPVDRP
ncbi:MAG: DUF4332 domain-containing protein [Nitrospirae bacterium]|nr:DUF4332 domain-containing protein [Nitrospirota bacterium]